MKILVLCSDNPSPPINGTRIRNHYLWPELRALGHEVRLLSLTRDPADLSLSNDEIEFFLFERPGPLKRVLMRLCYSYHQWPVSLTLARRVRELCESWRPDVVHAEELRMGAYLPAGSKAKLTVTAHNVESELLLKTRPFPLALGRGLFTRLYRFNLRRFERELFRRVDRAWAYSALDQQRYQALYQEARLAYTRNGTKAIARDEGTPPAPTELLFLGSLNYAPNIEGLYWFLDEIYPQLGAEFRLTVAGSGALLAASGEDAAQLRRNVTSPKGTTERALAVLMREEAWPALMEEAIAAATARSRELAG